VPRNDDGSGPATSLGFSINFFGRDRATAFVNNNGNITFDAPLATYTPFGLVGTRREIIAAFFADVDTRNAGSALVTYGQDTVDGRRAFGANYINVGYYNTKADKLNTFQLILIERSDTGAGNFDIEFNYERISWETGDASGGVNGYGGVPASAGWSNGSGEPGTSYELVGSLIPGSFLDSGPRALARRRLNSNLTGRYLFRARNGTIAPPLTITSGAVVPNGSVGEPYSYRMTSIGGSEPYRWSVVPDPGVQLPGLSLSADGILSGTPTASGTYDFTVSLTAHTEDGDQTVTLRSSITILAPSLVIPTESCTLPVGTVGVAYAHQLSARGGIGPYTWSWGQESPVPGLTLASEGTIQGLPRQAGTFSFSLRVTGDSESQPGTRACRVTIQPAPLESAITSCPAPTATLDVPFNQTLTAGGGVAPYRWAVAGQLPRGLSLTPDGRVSGLPSVLGPYNFTLQITDSRGQESTLNCQMDVGEPMLSIETACPLPAGTTGVPYRESLVVNGGEGPYAWTVMGSLPSGLSIDGSGVLSGRPGSAGPHHFRLVVTDREGRAASRPCNLIVNRALLSIASCPLPPARLGQSYQQGLEVVGGRGPYLWTVDGTLPSGLVVTNAGVLRGMPDRAGDVSFTLGVTDSTGLNAIRSCSISVQPEPLAIESACPLPAARLGTAYESRLTARGGISPYRWSVRGALPEGIALDPEGQFSGSALSTGDYNVSVVVTDSGGRQATTQCGLAVRLPEMPTMRLTGLAQELPPAMSLPTVTVELGASYPLALEGELALSITPETGSTEAEINQADASIRFLNGQRAMAFTIPAGERRLEVPLTTSGTVASRVTLSVTSLKSANTAILVLPAAASFQVRRAAPVVTDACFAPAQAATNLQVWGYTTSRQLSRASVTVGGASVTPRLVPLDTIAADYFLTAESVRTGGSFAIQFQIPVAAALNSEISVSLANSIGASEPRRARRCQ
jgi:hypothetical protein